jgi:hypothetical protein
MARSPTSSYKDLLVRAVPIRQLYAPWLLRPWRLARAHASGVRIPPRTASDGQSR